MGRSRMVDMIPRSEVDPHVESRVGPDGPSWEGQLIHRPSGKVLWTSLYPVDSADAAMKVARDAYFAGIGIRFS